MMDADRRRLAVAMIRQASELSGHPLEWHLDRTGAGRPQIRASWRMCLPHEIMRAITEGLLAGFADHDFDLSLQLHPDPDDTFIGRAYAPRLPSRVVEVVATVGEL